MFIRREGNTYLVEDINHNKIGDPNGDLLAVDRGLTAAARGTGKKVLRYMDLFSEEDKQW
jgi:hypothetical protein